MKKLYLLTTILILFCNSIYSQWAPIGAKWYYNHNSGSPSYLTVIESINDTLVLNRQCKVLKSYTIYVLGISPGIHQWDTLYCPDQYTYFDSSKVYLYDNLLNDFYMLYDFNATAGDTITVKDTLFSGYCPEDIPSNLFQFKVDSVGDTIINGINLRKQYASATQNSDWIFYSPPYPGAYNNYPIIERIGSLRYLFGTGISGIEGSISHLRCYEDSSITYHSADWPDTLDCDYLYTLITSINETENLQNNINVFPNPANNYTTFQLSKGAFISPINILIVDLTGRVIKSDVFSEGKNEYKMNTQSLNGLYYYIIEDFGKLIKKGSFYVNH